MVPMCCKHDHVISAAAWIRYFLPLPAAPNCTPLVWIMRRIWCCREHVVHRTSRNLVHVCMVKSGLNPDPISWTLSKGHVWKHFSTDRKQDIWNATLPWRTKQGIEPVRKLPTLQSLHWINMMKCLICHVKVFCVWRRSSTGTWVICRWTKIYSPLSRQQMSFWLVTWIKSGAQAMCLSEICAKTAHLVASGKVVWGKGLTHSEERYCNGNKERRLTQFWHIYQEIEDSINICYLPKIIWTKQSQKELSLLRPSNFDMGWFLSFLSPPSYLCFYRPSHIHHPLHLTSYLTILSTMFWSMDSCSLFSAYHQSPTLSFHTAAPMHWPVIHSPSHLSLSAPSLFFYSGCDPLSHQILFLLLRFHSLICFQYFFSSQPAVKFLYLFCLLSKHSSLYWIEY